MNKISKQPLLDQILYLIESIITSGPFAVSRDWFSLQLRIAHVKILFLLLVEGPQRMTDLSRTLDISLSGATTLVDRLVEQNLVHRQIHASNRRSVICILSEEGRFLTKRLLRERRNKWEHRLNKLTEPELNIVKQAMELIFNSSTAMVPKGDNNNEEYGILLESNTTN